MPELIKYSRIGEEDLELQTSGSDSTFGVTLPDGRQVTLTKISLGSFTGYESSATRYVDDSGQLIHAWGTKT